jgi:hypothetical protein
MQTTKEDVRFLKAMGVSLEPEPYPVVSGERYAQLVDRNDYLVMQTQELIRQNELCRTENRELTAKNADLAEAVGTWRALCLLVLVVLGIIAASGWMLWWYKP